MLTTLVLLRNNYCASAGRGARDLFVGQFSRLSLRSEKLEAVGREHFLPRPSRHTARFDHLIF
ncbi:MAG: hypothetical protein GY820_25735 [Gammaproteobacteria bacterium]|nr:hypothetical protein [Gammaproteobacteria bacterium]